MLTDATVRKAKAREKDYKLADSGGLHLFVTKSGHRSWRLKYRFGGKERRIVFGPYPEVSLAEARIMRDEAKRLLREGRDPGYEAKLAKLANTQRHENTFEALAREWHGVQKDRWTEIHAGDVIGSMERDLFPTLGDLAMEDIDEHLVLSALQAVEASVFKFARFKKVVTHNPADIGELLKPVPRGKRWPALLDLDKIRGLIAAVDRAGANPVTRLASRFMALTAQRPGMIRTAPWSEFHGISWDDHGAVDEDAFWLIPTRVARLDGRRCSITWTPSLRVMRWWSIFRPAQVAFCTGKRRGLSLMKTLECLRSMSGSQIRARTRFAFSAT